MKGFHLDLNRCTGCHACILACTNENALAARKSWRQVFTYNARRHAGVPRFHISLGCLHCANPACMKGCPASAYTRDSATDAVLLDPEHCIGCRYCSWACPFDAPHFDRLAGTMSKCTFCNERLREGKSPACASLCPTGALRFDELPDGTGTPSVPGFPETTIGPAIHVTPLRGSGPELSAVPEPLAVSRPLPQDPVPPRKITVESEWSLVFFSLAASVLVAIAAAGAAGSIRIYAGDFMIAALGTMAVSALHLGQWPRAWRAVLNLRRSWLSREIALFTAFGLLTGLRLLFAPDSPFFTWGSVLTGFATLFCIDRVYESVSAGLWSKLHSGRALLTGLFLFGILTHNAPVAGMAGLMKLILYAYRQPWTLSRIRMSASLLRLGSGFVAPLAIWNVFPAWVLPCVMLAEVVDRCEYYLDLEVVTPERTIAADLRKSLYEPPGPPSHEEM